MSSVSFRAAVVAIGFALTIWLAGSASAGGPLVTDGRVGSRLHLDGRGSRAADPRVPHRPRLGVKARPGTIVTPLVTSDARPIVGVPSVVLLPVPVVGAPPAPTEEAAPPAATATAPPRPAVPNPGPKIIEVAPPAPAARTVEVVVHRGSTTVVEKVPVP